MSENRQTKLAETALRIARGALGIILFLTGTSYLIIAIAIILSLPNRPDELGLIAVLAITMAAVIVASATTAFIYGRFRQTESTDTPDMIFWK